MLQTMPVPHDIADDSDDQYDLNDPHGASNEARLVEEARRGSRQAFGELVIRYERRLIRVIQQFVKGIEQAEDLAQETFIKAYERLDQFDPARRFGPWLFRIGVNHTLDFIRRRKRRGWWYLFTDRSAEKLPDPAVADPRQALDLEQEVEMVLNLIPENYRIVLMLRDLQNFSTSEIATMLGRKEATIRWRLAEARTMFQEYWVKRRDAVPLRGPAVEDVRFTPDSSVGNGGSDKASDRADCHNPVKADSPKSNRVTGGHAEDRGGGIDQGSGSIGGTKGTKKKR